jgi:2-methylisocitrate lyase-like PEP mutase family enzyme
MPAFATREGRLFWELHTRPRILSLPNPWDAGTATLLVSLGFEALATASFGMANAPSAPMARAPFSRAELRQKSPGNR